MSDDLSVALAACGFASVGEPPAMTLDVLGHAVHVTAEEIGSDRVQVTARITVRHLETGLERAALAAAGDTTFVVEGTDLVARRTLIGPNPATLHDAIYELAKATVVLSGADIDRPAPPPPAAAAAPPPPPAAAAPPPPATAAPESYWCFVDAPTPLRAGPANSDTVAMLVPGTWYAAIADDGTWVRIKHPSGAEGVALRTEVTPA